MRVRIQPNATTSRFQTSVRECRELVGLAVVQLEHAFHRTRDRTVTAFDPRFDPKFDPDLRAEYPMPSTPAPSRGTRTRPCPPRARSRTLASSAESRRGAGQAGRTTNCVPRCSPAPTRASSAAVGASAGASDAPSPPGVFVAAGLLTAVVVIGLIGVAHLRAADPAPTPVGDGGRGSARRGDALGRRRPHRARRASSQVVAEIVSLNGLADSAVRAGQTLVVPVGATR